MRAGPGQTQVWQHMSVSQLLLATWAIERVPVSNKVFTRELVVQRSGVQFLVEGPAPQWRKVVTGAIDAQQEPDTCSRGESLVMSPGFFFPTVALLASPPPMKSSRA